MNTQQKLKRIESTLEELASQGNVSLRSTLEELTSQGNVSLRSTLSSQTSLQDRSSSLECQNYSFDLRLKPLQPDRLPTDASIVPPFPVQQESPKGPSLPKVKSQSFSSHRNSANPSLATNLLKEIGTIVTDWQVEFQQILKRIQALYAEGPIVDGWLESHTLEAEPNTESTQRADGDRLMAYCDETIDNRTHEKVTCQSPRPGYRLCGLHGDGQLWSRPCPPEQLPGVSLAIARYQKLRQLLSRKQYLETRLSQLAETLTVLHSRLKEV